MSSTATRPSWKSWMFSLAAHAAALFAWLWFSSRYPEPVPPAPTNLLIDLAMTGIAGDTTAPAQDAPRPEVARDTAAPSSGAAEDSRPADNTDPDASEDSGEATAIARPDSGTLPTGAKPTDRTPAAESEAQSEARRARELRERQVREGSVSRALERLGSETDPAGPSGDQAEARGDQAGGLAGEGSGLTGELSGRPPLEAPRPDYPTRYLQEGIEGKVVLRIHVAPDGHVERVDLVQSSTRPQMDRNAREAVLRWKFPPLPSQARQVLQSGDQIIYFRPPE